MRALSDIRVAVTLLLACAVLALPTAAAQAATGGPDAAGNTFVDSREVGGPAAGPFTSIAPAQGGAGTDVGNHCDTCSTALTLPFPVTLYGQSSDQALVSSNGVLRVGDPADPSTTVVIAPFSADLDTGYPDSSTSGVYAQTTGTAGQRQTIVEWDAWSGATISEVGFQVVLHEGSTQVDFRYLTLDARATHKVFIQGGDGSDGRVLRYDTSGSDVESNLAVSYNYAPTADATTTTLIATPTTTSYGEPVHLVAHVSSADGSDVTTGSVTFSDANAGSFPPVPVDAAGDAVLDYSDLAPGGHTLTATYEGDGTHRASASAPVDVEVLPATTSISITRPTRAITYGTPVKATVTPSRATGDVRWYDGTRLVATTSDTGGTSYLLGTVLQPGSHALEAIFVPNDANYPQAGTGPVTVTVTKTGSSTKLAASPVRVRRGHATTFTATVRSAVAGVQPGGTVTFTEGRTTLGRASVGSGGTARLSKAFNATGYHTVVATYAGDGRHNASTASVRIYVTR